MLELLEFAQDFLSDIDHINHGGCGVAALALLRYARKHGVNTSHWSIVYWEDDWYDIERHNSARANGEALRAPTHVVLQIYDVCIDCTGEIWAGEDNWWDVECELDGVTEDELVLSLNHAPNWNSLFDRKTWVPIIESELDIDLSDVELY